MNDLQQFELLEDLRPFGSARAVLLRWNGRRYIPTDEEVEIFEFVGMYGGKRDRGYARFSCESNKWEVFGGMHEPVENWCPY